MTQLSTPSAACPAGGGGARRGRRIAFAGPSAPLECREVEVTDPGPGEVLVRVTHAGVCGSDVHRVAGELPDMGYPIAFGHEGIGTVEVLGSEVLDGEGHPLRTGDSVYWTTAKAPQSGLNKSWPPQADRASRAAFQDYALLAPDDVFFRIPEDTPAEAVIAFGCAMPTALSGFARLGQVPGGATVVVQGAGPVGLASTVLAGLSLAEQVIVIDVPGVRLDAASRLGATLTVPLDLPAEDRAALVRERTGDRGADVVVEATGVAAAFGEGTGLLADEGRYLVMGLYAGAGTVPLDPYRLTNRSLRVVGSLGPVAHPTEYLTTIRLARRLWRPLGLVDLVTHRFGLDRTAEAIAAASSGAAVKTVVVPAEG